MSLIIAAALLAVPRATTHTHRERFDHAGSAVEATYRGTLRTDMRQVGAVSAPGRPAALRCRWHARVAVDRHARHAAGYVAARRIEAPALLGGTRPGWCAGQRAAIQAAVAAAGERMRAHLVEVAARDRRDLIADLERTRG
ncbi:hypothetical protein [Sphingomonas sp.]|uniref:hypothetical protein n=1 Tax=Sphingomonas sp. TaxID=28214 RepID=UPI0035C80A90